MWSLGFENKLKEMCPFDIKFFYFWLNGKRPSYVSEKITAKVIEHWTNRIPVLISAQTGTGKNHFVQQVLIRKLDRDNKNNDECKKILILSNRVALTEQTELNLEEGLKDVTIDDWKKIVKVCSYQKFLEYISNLSSKKLEKLKNKVKYVVMDECHFFLSDSEFNPHTFEILEKIIKTFCNSIRIYMTATMEEVAYPILKLEETYYYNAIGHNPYDEPGKFRVSRFQDFYNFYGIGYDKFSCNYYYFERDYGYIEKIYEYEDFEFLRKNIVEGIKKNQQERWLIFVSSKKDGKQLLQELTEEKIKVAFLTSESKNSSKESEEYSKYREVVEKEKFSSQVLISTSVLDNGINIRDKTVKNVVVDMFDRTEMIQMLGRVRVEQEQKINLYLRNYSEQDIEKFFKNDVRKMLIRLVTDFVEKKRHKYYDELHRNENYQYQMEKIFYHTENEKQVFDYNHCAVYRLISRLTEFIYLLKEIKSEDYYINPKNFGDIMRRYRAEIFGNYSCGKRYNADYWKSKILRILASEEDKHEIPNFKVLDYTFQVYLNEIFLKKYQRRKNLSSSSVAFQNKILRESIGKNIPSLLKQVKWLGIDFIRFKNILQIQEKSTSNLPNVTDEEVAEILNTLSIPLDEYLKYTDNETKGSSGNKIYIRFRDKNLLETKGTQIGILNDNLKTTDVEREEQSIGNVEKFTKLIYWIKNKIELKHSSKLLDDIVGYCDSQPLEICSESYKLKIVRSTQNSQRLYVIVVKWTKKM